MIVIVDTNVWISAFVFSRPDRPASVPMRALKRAIRDDVLATSDELRAEIHRILTNRHLWTGGHAERELDTFLQAALIVRLKHNVHICRDPKDNTFLECAALAKADVLVSGDKDLLSLGSYAGTRILTPAEYVELPAG